MMMPCRELRSQFVFLGEGYLSGCLHTERLGIVGEDAVKAFSIHGLNLPIEDGWEISH